MCKWNKALKTHPQEIACALTMLAIPSMAQKSDVTRAKELANEIMDGARGDLCFGDIDNTELRLALYGRRIHLALKEQLPLLKREIDDAVAENRHGLWLTDDRDLKTYTENGIEHKFGYTPPSLRAIFDEIHKLLFGAKYEIVGIVERDFQLLSCGRVALKTEKATVLLTPPEWSIPENTAPALETV